MIKDIIYAGFAQLSYLDWHKLRHENLEALDLKNNSLNSIFDSVEVFNQIKTPDYNKWDKGNNEYYESLSEEGHKIYAKEDSRIFYLYSEDDDKPDENPKFSEFSDWEFLFGYNHNKILKEAGNIIGELDSGFQASVFKNGSKVMIAYRGTDEKADWFKTNLPLGLNNYVDQLICSAYVYDKVKEKEDSSEIYITGHSLGGALAQFAFVYSGCNHKTITWNGLGIGEVHKELNITSVNVNNKILLDTLEELKYIDGKIWQEKCLVVSDKDAKEISAKYIKIALDKGQGTGYLTEGFSPEELLKLEKELVYKLKVMYKFQSNYHPSTKSSQIENIYFTDDLTPNLQKRIGIITKADKDFEEIEIDKGKSSIVRKLKMFLTKKFVSYHPVTNFMVFIDKEGKLQEGNINDIHMLNAFKTLLITKNMPKLEIEKILQKGETNSKVLYDLFCELFDKLEFEKQHRTGGIVSEDAKLLNNMNFDIEKEIRKYKTNNKDIFTKDEKYSYLGKFSNLSELGGVTYGSPKLYKLMKEILREMKDEFDIPTYNFLSEYENKYWLHEKVPPFSYAKSILNPNKVIAERYKVVYVWDLAYKLFVKEQKEIGKIRNKGERDARTLNLNQTKESFEKAISGYTKESYEIETTDTKAMWRKWGNMDGLLKILKEEEQPELIKYIESYKEIKEKTREINKEKAENYEEEQKAIELEKQKEKDMANLKRRRADLKKRLAEIEEERKGKGWKIGFKEDGWGYH